MDADNFHIEEAGSSHDIVQYLDERIYEYNSAAIQKADGRTFSYVIRDANARIVAGATGWTWAGACEILLLWVDEGMRNKGIGEKLLISAEEEAIRRDCKVIVVRSYSFQAPNFYQEHGYATEHVIKNFPNGCQQHTLIKRF